MARKPQRPDFSRIVDGSEEIGTQFKTVLKTKDQRREEAAQELAASIPEPVAEPVPSRPAPVVIPKASQKGKSPKKPVAAQLNGRLTPELTEQLNTLTSSLMIASGIAVDRSSWVRTSLRLVFRLLEVMKLDMRSIYTDDTKLQLLERSIQFEDLVDAFYEENIVKPIESMLAKESRKKK